MDPLKIEFKTYYNEIIEAITEVYGLEYYEIIKKRFSEIKFIPYTNKNGIKAYYNYLESCKAKELTLEFLSHLGTNINDYNIENLNKQLPDELRDLCYGYLGTIFPFEEYILDDDVGFKSFLEKYYQDNHEDIRTISKIEFINFIRGKEQEEINIENYKDFTKTKEYQEIYNLALKLDKIYEPLRQEMKLYLNSIKVYKSYYENEEKRLNKILKQFRDKLYQSIEDLFPENIKQILDKEENISNKNKKIFDNNIMFESPIEYFSKEYENQLRNPNTTSNLKKVIHCCRLMYFKRLGYDIDIYNTDYDEFIKSDDIKQLIPTYELVEKISNIRKQFSEEIEKQYILESETYKEILKKLTNNKKNRQYLLEIIKNKKICLTLGNSSTKLLIPYVFLTQRETGCGAIDYVIIHEIIHAIESDISINREYRTGFETNIYNMKYSPYQHNELKRKYERFNETITDMITIEVREKLFNKNIYFAEPKNRIKIDVSESNTCALLKELLFPFYNKYKNLILKVRITGNITELTNEIGVDNYEKINDIIDHIDYLIEQELLIKLSENNFINPLVLEYQNLLNELNIIYSNLGIFKEKESTNTEQKNNKKKYLKKYKKK